MQDFHNSQSQISPYPVRIRQLFAPQSDRCFSIPEYQRDYSWNLQEKQPQQFFSDIVDRVQIVRRADGEDGYECVTQSYFIGTMLFKGDWQQEHDTLEVIDGQQRLTTIYLFLGALSNRLIDTARDIRRYIDANDPPCRNEWTALGDDFEKQGMQLKRDRLQTRRKVGQRSDETHPRLTVAVRDHSMSVMEVLIFGSDEEKAGIRPRNQAEKNIIDTYYYLYRQLEYTSLAEQSEFATILGAGHGALPDGTQHDGDDGGDGDRESAERKRLVCHRRYEQLLIDGILEQLGTPSVVVLSIMAESTINEVFESLNSKGKSLDQIDLVKNHIFKRLPANPLNHARAYWTGVKNTLSKERTADMTRDPWVGLDEFYTQFWIVQEHGRATGARRFYAEFQRDYGNASESDLIDFLRRADDFAHDVACLYGIEDLSAVIDKEYRARVEEGIRYLVRAQRARQCYPLIAAALYACRQGSLKARVLAEMLDYLAVAFLFLTANDVRGSKYTTILHGTAYALYRTARQDAHAPITRNRRSEIATWHVRSMQDRLAALLPDAPSDKTLDMMLDDETMTFHFSNKVKHLRSNRLRVSYLLHIRCIQRLKAGKRLAQDANHAWNIEHIVPDGKETGSFTHQLGNLLWLDKDTNDACADKPLADKARLYRSSPNPEARELDGFLASDDMPAAVAERSRRILRELFEQVIVGRTGACPDFNSRLVAFDTFTKKKFAKYLGSGDWYHSFASRFVEEHGAIVERLQNNPADLPGSYTLRGIPFPNDDCFTTPFVYMRGRTGIAQLGRLLQYIDEGIDRGHLFHTTDGKEFSADEPFPNVYRKALTAYRNFLEEEMQEDMQVKAAPDIA